MARSKVQTIEVKLRFDQPVTKTEAKRLFADHHYGEDYPYLDRGDGSKPVESMKIVSPKIRTSF